ncbi:hypothetical protein [Acidihalobacter prosperus]
MRKIKLFTTLALLMLTLGLGANSLAAGNSHQEIDKALLHAKFLLKAKTLAHMHKHMHHIVNCLVGKNGNGFNHHFMNPCKGLGNGAIHDENSKLKRTLLKQVDQLASIGLKIKNSAAAHDVGLAIHTLLEQAAR